MTPLSPRATLIWCHLNPRASERLVEAEIAPSVETSPVNTVRRSVSIMFAPLKYVSLTLAKRRSAWPRLAFTRVAVRRSASPRSANERSDSLRSAAERFADQRLAPCSFAVLKFAKERSAASKLTLRRFASLKFAVPSGSCPREVRSSRASNALRISIPDKSGTNGSRSRRAFHASTPSSNHSKCCGLPKARLPSQNTNQFILSKIRISRRLRPARRHRSGTDVLPT